jgi:hypothetical protein
MRTSGLQVHGDEHEVRRVLQRSLQDSRQSGRASLHLRSPKLPLSLWGPTPERTIIGV